MAPDNRIAVCPGTYDPITLGHVDVITRAAAMFDELIVGVVDASVRKSKPLFSGEERARFVEDATGHLSNVKIELFKNLVVDFARERGARAIVKGLRAISDFEYEMQMAHMNRHLSPTVETVFLMPDEANSFLSSRLVKEVFSLGGDVAAFVPPAVHRRLQETRGATGGGPRVNR
jgi:pantetheine-phosphate adenylyltransferase